MNSDVLGRFLIPESTVFVKSISQLFSFKERDIFHVEAFRLMAVYVQKQNSFRILQLVIKDSNF